MGRRHTRSYASCAFAPIHLLPDIRRRYCTYVKLSQGKVSIDEEKELSFYERGWNLLAELGYAQYEISNFARPDAECRHNMNTWRMHEWIGCGPSSASQYNGERYQRPANLEEWCLGMESTTSPKTERFL